MTDGYPSQLEAKLDRANDIIGGLDIDMFARLELDCIELWRASHEAPSLRFSADYIDTLITVATATIVQATFNWMQTWELREGFLQALDYSLPEQRI